MLGSAKWPSCVITFSIEEIPPTANRNWHSDQNKKKKKKRKVYTDTIMVLNVHDSLRVILKRVS